MACTSCNETTNICGCNQTNSVCFTYQGADLDCIGVPCGVSLEAVLAAINQKICEIRDSIINIDGGENYTLNLNVNELQLLKDGITNSVVDLSKYLDNINLQSLSVDNNTGILTATLTDNSTRTVDLSNLFTDTVITTFTNSRNGNDITLTINDTGGNTYSTTFTDNSGAGGGVQSVNSGTNVNVDNTDPLNPIVNVPNIGEDNVQADWNETDNTSDSFILNKPTIEDTEVTSINFTGTTTKTLTLNQSNGNNLTATFTDDSGGGGATNLTYTPSPTQGTVVSDTGTDAIVPLVDSTNAGLFPPTLQSNFTPVFTDNGGGATYSYNTNNSSSYYYKVGNLIFIHININSLVSSGTPTGQFIITGLPSFNILNHGATDINYPLTLGAFESTNANENTSSVQAIVQNIGGTPTISFRYFLENTPTNAGGSQNALSLVEFVNADLELSGFYLTN